MTLPNNIDSEQRPDSRGFLNADVDEIFCKTLSGQCNVHSLFVIEDSSSTKENSDWLLVVTLSGKLYRFIRRPNSSRVSTAEFDLRNEFPSHCGDLEVSSSCVYHLLDAPEVFLFLACVDSRSQGIDNGRAPSGVSLSPPGLIFIVKISPPWKESAPLASVVRSLQTSYSPTLIVLLPLRKSTNDNGDRILCVSGNDRTIHGYRIEATPSGRNDQISIYECFLGETFSEFDALLRRPPLSGAVLQMAIAYHSSDNGGQFHRFMAFGLDNGLVSIFQADATQNDLVKNVVERYFDTPISRLRLIPSTISDFSLSKDITNYSLLVCPAVGPARLYSRIESADFSEANALIFPRSDQFDCITCVEVVLSDSANYVLLGMFAGKLLIYSLDGRHSSVALVRVHSFLYPVMSIVRFSQRFVAVLLLHTILIFEL